MLVKTQQTLDKFAIGASVICAIHCAVLPIMLTVFPALISLPVADHEFHLLLVWLILPTSAAAFGLGCKSHRDYKVLVSGAIGLLVILLTAFFGHDLVGEDGEKVATLVGASILAFAHWRNFSLCQKKDCCSGV